MEKDALERAVRIVGGQTALAQILGKSQSHVWYWLNKGGRVPAEHAVIIEAATKGEVTRHQLRPDVFPKESAA